MGAAECKGQNLCGCSDRMRIPEMRPGRDGVHDYGTSGTVGGPGVAGDAAASPVLSVPRSARASRALDVAAPVADGRATSASVGSAAQHNGAECLATCYFKREAAELETLAWAPTARQRRHYAFRTGAIYDGEWLGNQRHGLGTQIWPDGAVYIGEWRENRAAGHGRFAHSDGDVYTGQWSEDHAHGRGVYLHREGTRFEGEFVEDLQQGFGVERWPDGSRFAGEFAQGRKSGGGVYDWADGSSYAGQWRENQIDGCGMYTGAEGRVYRGSWRQSMMHGCGSYRWADGRLYEGQHHCDQKSGFGVFTWSDERRYEGYWASGRQHGAGRLCRAGSGAEARLALWVKGERAMWLEEAPCRQPPPCGQREEAPQEEAPALLRSAVPGDGL